MDVERLVTHTRGGIWDLDPVCDSIDLRSIGVRISYMHKSDSSGVVLRHGTPKSIHRSTSCCIHVYLCMYDGSSPCVKLRTLTSSILHRMHEPHSKVSNNFSLTRDI